MAKIKKVLERNEMENFSKWAQNPSKDLYDKILQSKKSYIEFYATEVLGKNTKIQGVLHEFK